MAVVRAKVVAEHHGAHDGGEGIVGGGLAAEVVRLAGGEKGVSRGPRRHGGRGGGEEGGEEGGEVHFGGWWWWLLVNCLGVAGVCWDSGGVNETGLATAMKLNNPRR